MFDFAQNDLVYAQDFFDHLVKEGALGEDIGEVNRRREIEPCELVKECVTTKGDIGNEVIKVNNHGRHEKKGDQEHEVKTLGHKYNSHRTHENDDRGLHCGPGCEEEEGLCDHHQQEDEDTCDAKEHGERRVNMEVQMIDKREIVEIHKTKYVLNDLSSVREPLSRTSSTIWWSSRETTSMLTSTKTSSRTRQRSSRAFL